MCVYMFLCFSVKEDLHRFLLNVILSEPFIISALPAANFWTAERAFEVLADPTRYVNAAWPHSKETGESLKQELFWNINGLSLILIECSCQGILNWYMGHFRVWLLWHRMSYAFGSLTFGQFYFGDKPELEWQSQYFIIWTLLFDKVSVVLSEERFAAILK